MQVTLISKFLGCLKGSALGDAIGELAFRARSRILLDAEIEISHHLRYTDDTAMAISVAKCLIEKGAIDPEYLGALFHEEYSVDPWRGYASGPPSIFRRVESEGIKYAEAATELFGGTGSFGNGSAMRVAPVGLFFPPDELYDRARESALPTHTHELAVDGAAVQAKSVSLALAMQPEDGFPRKYFLGELARFARTDVFRAKIALIEDLAASDTPDTSSARELGRSVAVHESLPFAIYCFTKYPDSYEECIHCAVLNRGDRDTLGAMAGAISGAYLGESAIPEKWRRKLEQRDLFEKLAHSLFEKATR